MTTKIPLIDVAAWYHEALFTIMASIVDDPGTAEFGLVAGIYQIAISEANEEANRRHQEFAARQFERQTIALERIAAALAMRESEPTQ